MEFSLQTFMELLLYPFSRLQSQIDKYRRTQDYLKGLRCVQVSEYPVSMEVIPELLKEFNGRGNGRYFLPTIEMIRSSGLGDSFIVELKKVFGLMDQSDHRAPLWRKHGETIVPFYPSRRFTGEITQSRRPARCLLFFYCEEQILVT